MGRRVFEGVALCVVASKTADPGISSSSEGGGWDPVGIIVLVILVVLGLEIRFRRTVREVLGSPVPLRRAELDSTQVIQSLPSKLR